MEEKLIGQGTWRKEKLRRAWSRRFRGSRKSVERRFVRWKMLFSRSHRTSEMKREWTQNGRKERVRTIWFKRQEPIYHLTKIIKREILSSK